MYPRRSAGSRSSQRGAALLVFALIFAVVLLSTFLNGLNSSSFKASREQTTSDALTQAKEALIGKAVSERKNDLFGFLQLPDLGTSRNLTPGEGCSTIAEEGCTAGNFPGNAKSLSVIGRLPWRTLGLAPLKDADGECLWYVVSGAAQVAQPPDVFNWDTVGHFEVFSSDGTPPGTVSTSGTNNYHNRPLALVISAGPPLAGQNRAKSATDTVSDCGGNYDAKNYLDSYAADANINSIVNYFSGPTNNATGDASAFATPKAIIAGDIEVLIAGNKVRIANDRILTITAKDVFDRAKKRSDFKADIDALLDDITLCLNNLPLTGTPPNVLPVTSAINKGVGNYPTPGPDTDLNDVLTICKPASVQKQNVMINWQDNLLYTKPGAASSLNGETGCNAILFFSGTRQGAQSRATPTQKADPSNYLEGGNLALFPGYGAYTSPPSFDGLTNNGANSSFDIARCIKGLPVGSTQKSFAADFGSFAVAGPSGGAAVTPDVINQTVAITDASGIGNGCFWFPTSIPLVAKTLRAYYEFQFFYADKFAAGDLSDPDRGNGFTFQMVRGDVGALDATKCGTEANMGALGSSDIWGSFSFIIETDVHKDASKSDPTENHTAIMTNGSLTHAAGTVTTACNGTAKGCSHSPANKSEESPTPLAHNQRIEINTGCNLGCAICNPASTNTYAKVSAWVDCTDCTDISTDLDRTTKPPTVMYCTTTPLSTPEMNSIYFGFTGGFSAGATAGEAPAQGVTIKRFSIRSD
jgi:hypothetical protein